MSSNARPVTLGAYEREYDREAFKREIRRRYVYENEPITKIAKDLPPSRSTIQRWIIQWGWFTPERPTYDWSEVERMVRARVKAGDSLHQASQHVEPSYGMVTIHARQWDWWDGESLAAKLARAHPDDVSRGQTP